MQKVVVFMPSFAGGGAESVTLALCGGLARNHFDVHLVVGTGDGELRDSVPDDVSTCDIGASRTAYAIGGLLRYLRRERPDVVISAISHANIIAAFAVKLAMCRCKLIVVHHNTTSISTRRTLRRRDRLVPLLCGIAYRLADRIIAVSAGVADDLARSSHLPIERIQVLPNPIDYARIRELSRDAARQDSVPCGDGPLLVAAGRLEPQKGLDTLLRSIAQVESPCRLVILGDGSLRAELLSLVENLGLAGRVSLPGFVANPYPYFRQAQVYVLSSRWEGLPTVLLEALAFRLRIVSTDCPSGPSEILSGVQGAELVPVDDPGGLAAAIERAISAGPLGTVREEWREYDSALVIRQMCEVVHELSHGD
ncbi:MAG: glycosyl transferase [Pseudonocardiales bacterium]|nr:MAG: glycosyl transferase [Pseudonocardiales bacterium]